MIADSNLQGLHSEGTVIKHLTALLACLVLAVFVGFRESDFFWMLGRDELIVAFGFAGSFLFAHLLLSTRVLYRNDFSARLLRFGIVTMTTLIGLLVIFLMLKLRLRVLTLAGELALFVGLLALMHLVPRRWIASLVTLVAVAIVVWPYLSNESFISIQTYLNNRNAGQDKGVRFISSVLHDVRVKSLQIFDEKKVSGEFSMDRVEGGGLNSLGDNKVLLATGDGEFHVLELNGDRVNVQRLNIDSPMNRDRYEEESSNPLNYFRVTDARLDGKGPLKTLFVAHHYWDAASECISLRVSERTLDLGPPDIAESNWKVRFESKPCFEGDFYNGTGGRMAIGENGNLFLTVGITHKAMAPYATDDDYSYGKIIEIDRKTWKSRVYSRGHRNPQGLLVVDGEIWSTEHARQGGDELNFIVQDGDYGYPLASYGTDYGSKVWKTDPENTGVHAAGIPPVFAWVPSIGISNLIKVKGEGFPNWKGDLLVSSLNGMGFGYSLYRVTIRDSSARVVERINTNLEIRDLMELEDGRFLLWDGAQRLQIVSSMSHVFSQCNGCHAIYFHKHGIGPDLVDVVGANVARFDDYGYSPALKRFGGKWTRSRLQAFLKNPQELVPGTTMHFEGIEDPSQRAEVIEYLLGASRSIRGDTRRLSKEQMEVQN